MDPNSIDKSRFTNVPFMKRIEKPWGYELLFTEPELPYTGKILHISRDRQISLQQHDMKLESQMLVSGRCLRIIDNEKGDLVSLEMEPYQGYTILPGQRHRLRGITDCDIFEVSSPEVGITYRLEDDYKRPNETEAMRAEDRV